jgi:glass
MQHQQNNNYASAPQASVSYIASVHPQMHLLSPTSYNNLSSQSQNPSYLSSGYDSCVQHPTSAIYPSMSVNVSMNMTMHGCSMDAPGVQCAHSQVKR